MYFQKMTRHCFDQWKTLIEQCRDCEGVYIEDNKVNSFCNQNKSIYIKNPDFY